MTDSQVVSDLSDTAECSPAPHPRVRQHGTKHRDFSASRLQARERARERVQQAIQDERARAREQAESWRAAGLSHTIDGTKDQRSTPQAVIEKPDTLAAPVGRLHAPEQGSLWPQLESESAPDTHRLPQLGEELESADGYAWPSQEESARPAWLRPHRAEIAEYLPPHTPADTLQGVRDRLASRWFGLKGMFENAAAVPEALPEPAAMAATSAPVLAVFSLAGGVGKSSLTAALARTLSACGERVLLVETTAYGLLPFFFGARDRRPGVLRTFAPPEGDNDAPVQMIALDADSLPETNDHDPLAAEIARCGQGASRIIVDIATASAEVARRVLRMSPLVLVPVVPDMNSVVNTGFIDCVFHRKGNTPGISSEVYYVLNQFDLSLPLHLDVREVLRERLGDRLLPFALHRTPAVSEALAEGMTVVDYAPVSHAAEEFNSLAAWLRARYAPAGAAARGTRWIEK